MGAEKKKVFLSQEERKKLVCKGEAGGRINANIWLRRRGGGKENTKIPGGLDAKKAYLPGKGGGRIASGGQTLRT